MSRIRWGILGAGKIARDLVIPAILLSRNGALSALASRDAARRNDFSNRFAIPQVYDDYQALLDSPHIDAVYIPLPNTLHVEWTERVLLAGKHVLCEKPIAMHAGEIDRLIAARDRSGCIAGEAFMVAHHPQWHLARKLIANGTIGRLRMVQGAYTYFNANASNIRNQSALGGGGLRDIGVYPIVTTRIATAREPHGAQAHIEWDPHFGTDRFAECKVAFDDFSLSFYCGTQSARRQEMVFHGEQGWFKLDTPFNPQVYGQAQLTLRLNDGSPIEHTIFPDANHYQLMVENFGDAIRGKSAFAFPLESSRANQQVIDMLFASANAR